MFARLTPVRSFLVLAVPAGLALVFLTPPLQVPDEFAHFCRAYQLAVGQLIPAKSSSATVDATGGKVPVALAELNMVMSQVCHNPRMGFVGPAKFYTICLNEFNADYRTTFASFSNSAIHSPVIYLPQAAAVALASRLTPRVCVWLWAGRLANLAVFLTLVAWAIHLTPVYRWVFVATSLTPMCLFQAASLSSDVLTNALATLYLALSFRLAHAGMAADDGLDPSLAAGRDEAITRDLGRFVLLAALLLHLKQMYSPVLLLVALVPRRLWSYDRCRRLGRTLAAAAGVALLAAGWLVVVRHIYSPMKAYIDPAGQAAALWADPLLFGRVFATTWLDSSAIGLFQMYLGVLGALDTMLPNFIYLILGAGLFATAIADRPPAGRFPTIRQLGLLTAVLVVNCLLITLVIYLTWMAVAANYVQVQGRYLIPIAPIGFAVVGGVSRYALGPGKGGTAPRAWVLSSAMVGILAMFYFLLSRYFALDFLGYFDGTPKPGVGP